MTYDQYKREIATKALAARLARDDDNARRLDRYANHRIAWKEAR